MSESGCIRCQRLLRTAPSEPLQKLWLAWDALREERHRLDRLWSRLSSDEAAQRIEHSMQQTTEKETRTALAIGQAAAESLADVSVKLYVALYLIGFRLEEHPPEHFDLEERAVGELIRSSLWALRTELRQGEPHI